MSQLDFILDDEDLIDNLIKNIDYNKPKKYEPSVIQ